jgi:hypothetical protein
MAFLNIFATRPERSVSVAPCAAVFAKVGAGPGGTGLPPGGRGPRKTGAGATCFLLASVVLGLARSLHRRGLIGAWGLSLALTLAERLSARGIAKWRTAQRPMAANDRNEVDV